MKPPILVRAEGELMVFDSPARAEQYVEHYDVEAGVYDLVFDSEGRKLHFDVIKNRWWAVPKIVLTEAEISPGHSEELRGILIEALGPAAHDEPLQELVQEALTRFEQR